MIYKKLIIGGIHKKAVVTTYVLDNTPEVDENRRRPLVVICPGGAYYWTSDREAEAIAIKLNSYGYNAAVIRYTTYPYHFPEALCQLARTVAYFKENAAAYNTDSAKIYTMGFSAGGHLAASLGTFWNEEWLLKLLQGVKPEEVGPEWLANFKQDEVPVCDKAEWEAAVDDMISLSKKQQTDEIKENNELSVNITESSQIQPAKQILCYPVITSGDYAHKDSFKNLSGFSESEKPDIWEQMSLEKHITKDVPQTFIWHTFGDMDVPVWNSLLLAQELHKNNVPVELHIYEEGHHGLSLSTREVCNEEDIVPEVQSWMMLLDNWIKK